MAKFKRDETRTFGFLWLLTGGLFAVLSAWALYDNQVSRQHTRMFMKDGKWHLQDLGSRNGTFIGKHRIDSIAPLESGQMFRLGRTWLRLGHKPNKPHG